MFCSEEEEEEEERHKVAGLIPTENKFITKIQKTNNEIMFVHLSELILEAICNCCWNGIIQTNGTT